MQAANEFRALIFGELRKNGKYQDIGLYRRGSKYVFLIGGQLRVAQAAGGSGQVGYAIGRLMTMIGSKGAAEKMRKPVIRTEFGRAAALIRGMAAGTSGTASEEVYKKRLEILDATVGALEEKMNEQ